MRLIVNNTTTYTQADIDAGAITIASDDELRIEFEPISVAVGLGVEAWGYERGGFGGSIAPDIHHYLLEILDTDTIVGDGLVEYQPRDFFVYTAAQNTADNGSYATDLTLRVVQVDLRGVRKVLGEVQTT